MKRHAPIALLAVLSLAGTAYATPLALPRKQATEPRALVPAGWAEELAVEGDLNADGLPDRVLVLLQNQSGDAERERALMVLFRDASGYTVAGTNLGVLACFECLGVKGGEGTPTLEIKRGVLSVSQWGGSNEWYASVHRFRWSGARGALELIGLDTSSGEGLTGASRVVGTNLLTGKQLTTITPPQVDAQGSPHPAAAQRITERRKPPKLLPLESTKSAF